jgi:phage major head subunit gpT-like protein
MFVNDEAIELTFRGFQKLYNDAFDKAESNALKVAMEIPSVGREETYGWIGQFPMLREWFGQRVVHSLKASSFTIKNRKFESTVSVPRDALSDDRIGVFGPAFANMGWLARQHPEELVFGLLAKGFSEPCYDGQFFFDTDHPIQSANNVTPTTFSNMAAGSGPAWFLIDTRHMIRPIIWQVREKYEFQRMDKPNDSNVFFNDEYYYGVRARVNAGFGLPQLAYASREALNDGSYAAARAAMMNFRSDGGRVLGIKPNLLIVPPALESAALHVLNAEFSESGASNPWKDTAELIVTPFVAT